MENDRAVDETRPKRQFISNVDENFDWDSKDSVEVVAVAVPSANVEVDISLI